MILLLLARTALALDCAEITQMTKVGIPAATVAATISPCSVDAATVDCLVSATAPPEVIVAARAAAAAVCEAAPVEEPIVTRAAARATPATTRPSSSPATRRAELPAEYWKTPEPAVALGLSLVVGLGSGHFYANQPAAGVVFGLAEIAGAAMVLASATSDSPSPSVTTSGAVLFGFARAVDVIAAPINAQATRRRMLDG